MTEIFRPKPESAIGNLLLSMVSHYVNSKNPVFHKDVLAYGRDKMLEFSRISDDHCEVNEGNVKGEDFKILHLKYQNIGECMRRLIKPTPFLQERIDHFYEEVKDCKAGFHIRRGLAAEDSAKFGYFPFASMQAVESMIQEAIRIDEPVYVLSDSFATKEYFKMKVPKAVILNIQIGFTADEHSQFVTVEDEGFDAKVNSMVEWFLLTKMPKIYMTNGGINKRNVVGYVEEGLTSTFGYAAALYADKVPYYVFNDGFIFLPTNQMISKSTAIRYNWSDIVARQYISYSLWGDNKVYTYGMIENVFAARKHFPMWILKVHVNETVPLPIVEWLAQQPNVEVIRHPGFEKRSANTLWRYCDAFMGEDQEEDVIALFRDADSRLSARDARLVHEWLASTKDFHIVRDHPGHTVPVLAGTFGLRHKGLKYLPQQNGNNDINKPPMNFVRGKDFFISYISKITPETDRYMVDQFFLAQLYPFIINRTLVHASDNAYEPFATPIEHVETGFIGEVVLTTPNASKIFGEEETEFVKEYQSQ